MNSIKCLLFGMMLMWSSLVVSQNPIIKDIGMSDPHVRVFNDTVYLYTGNDDHPEDRTWVMKNWEIFSTTDLVNWRNEGDISPADNYMGAGSTDCWAGDAESRNGKYYFYFSDRSRSIGVMVADSPVGPFRDALGKPLVEMHDPTVLIDDDADRTPYLIYGAKDGGGFYIVKLNDDMISLAETPQVITIIGEEWDNAPLWMDKNYIFKHEGRYYLSWGRDYAVSENPYGPYHCVGAVGQGHELNQYAHGSFFWWKGQFYHIWCYYPMEHSIKYRETIISYCHIDAYGNIVTDTGFLDSHMEYGVARYQASWPKIEAEWYSEIALSDIRKQGNRESGIALTDLRQGSWVKFSNMQFEDDLSQINAQLSWIGKGTLEVRLDGVQGPLGGVVKLRKSKKRGDAQLLFGSFEPIVGERDVYLVFKGNSNLDVTLDWFRFAK